MFDLYLGLQLWLGPQNRQNHGIPNALMSCIEKSAIPIRHGVQSQTPGPEVALLLETKLAIAAISLPVTTVRPKVLVEMADCCRLQANRAHRQTRAESVQGECSSLGVAFASCTSPRDENANTASRDKGNAMNETLQWRVGVATLTPH